MGDYNKQVTNLELVEYLQMTYNILKVTKSNLDIDRLEEIIIILKDDNNKIYRNNAKRTRANNHDIIRILEKMNQSIELCDKEKIIYEDFLKNKKYGKWLKNSDLNGIYSFLQDKSNRFSMEDLGIIYYYLYKEKSRQKKREDLQTAILHYIEQTLYFSNMDLQYQEKNNL